MPALAFASPMRLETTQWRSAMGCAKSGGGVFAAFDLGSANFFAPSDCSEAEGAGRQKIRPHTKIIRTEIAQRFMFTPVFAGAKNFAKHRGKKEQQTKNRQQTSPLKTTTIGRTLASFLSYVFIIAQRLEKNR